MTTSTAHHLRRRRLRVVAVSLLVLVSTLGPLMAADLPEAVAAGFACLAFLAALTIAVFLPQAVTSTPDGQRKRG